MTSRSHASGFVTKALRADGSTEDRVRQVKAEVDAADRKAHQAYELAADTGQRVTSLEDRLSSEVDRLRTELETARKADAAADVPLAVVGLTVTAIGTIAGLVGSLLVG